MDWLQRYVDNVKTYLPARLRDDVGSELYSGLQDQCDDLEEHLRRAPSEQEILALLQERGHPMAVAAAYQPRRTLVSEPLFPVYLQVLKLTMLVLAVVSAAAVIGSLFTQDKPDFLSAVIRWLASVYEGGIHAFAWVTLVFYLAGESLGYRKVFTRWNPRSLPKISNPSGQIPRFDSGVECVVTLLAMAWLNDLWRLPGGEGGSSLILSPELGAMLPWLNIALGLSVILSLIKLFAPYWTQRRLLIDAALNIYWLVLLAMLLGVYPPFSIEWHSGDLWEPDQGSWQVTVGIVIAITAWDLFGNLRRLLRARLAS